MKLLTATGLTKLIEIIKSSFISTSDVEETDEISIDTTVTEDSENLITSGAVYDGLASKQDEISDLSTIRSNATNGQSAYTTISSYGNIVTHNTSEFATSSQGSKADSALQPNDNISELNNNVGYITGITSSDVTVALGYTPYNSTNPSGYQTATQVNSAISDATSSFVTKEVANLTNYTTTTDLNTLLAGKQPVGDYATNTALSQGLATKQDTISDLGDIRSGAELGATALQSVPSEYITETELQNYHDTTKYDASNPDNFIDNTVDNLVNYKNNTILEPILGNKLNKQMITNCLTEVPQNIKLELNNGTLTLKAGSKVTIPNGFESDGVTPKSEDIEINSDINKAKDVSGSGLYFVVYDKTTNTLSLEYTASCYSRDAYSYTGLYYRTDLNIVRYYGGSVSSKVFTLPIALVNITSSTIASIEKIFNCTGFMDKTFWVNKGVKGLIPNGRNADGSLKNIEFETENLYTLTESNTGSYKIYIDANGIYNYSSGTYDEVTNLNKNTAGSIVQTCYCGYCTKEAGVISNFHSKTAFHALDYNDSSTISGWSMPSNNYINLSLGASGTVYTAPATGWFRLSGGATSGTRYIGLQKSQSIVTGLTVSGISNANIMLPVKKGEAVSVQYSADTSLSLRFIYAEGEV